MCMFAVHDLVQDSYLLAALTHLIAFLNSQSYLLSSDAHQLGAIPSHLVLVAATMWGCSGACKPPELGNHN